LWNASFLAEPLHIVKHSPWIGHAGQDLFSFMLNVPLRWNDMVMVDFEMLPPKDQFVNVSVSRALGTETGFHEVHAALLKAFDSAEEVESREGASG
jgi:hypothetical protein